MKTRSLTSVLMAMLFLPCGGESGEAPAAAEMTDEEQLGELRDNWAQHYNMQHASVVADYYTDEVVSLNAVGAVLMGREANAAGLEAQMAGSPTISLAGQEMMVFDGRAVALGSYSVETASPEGDAMTITGSYLTSFTKESGDWKIDVVVTNYDSPRPDGWPYAVGDGEDPPEDEGTMTDMLGGPGVALQHGPCLSGSGLLH
jgi:ketosteroid isomerase-like protein